MAFDQAIADKICERLENGQTLTSICRDVGIARQTAHNWLSENSEFAGRFARAKHLGFDAIADDCADIADDGRNDFMERLAANGDEKAVKLVENGEHIQRSRLRVDTRLKLLAKWDPKRYGDRLHTDNDTRVTVVLRDMRKESDGS